MNRAAAATSYSPMHRTPALLGGLALLLVPSLALAEPAVCRATCEPTAGDSLSPEESRAVSASFEGILNALRPCLDTVGASAINPAVILRFDANGALISKRYDLSGYENLACARDLVNQPTSVAIRRSTSLKCESRCGASTPSPSPTPAPISDTPPRKETPKPKKEPPRRHHDDDDDDASDEPVRTAKNVVFAELLGNGLGYSVNYERLFDDTGFGVRAGFSYLSLGASGGTGSTSSSVRVSWISVPILANYYVGSANHKLQLGLGVSLVYATSEGRSADVFGSVSGLVPFVTGVIGYRYLPAKGGFNFGIGFTPLFIPGGETRTFLPWGGIGLGAAF